MPNMWMDDEAKALLDSVKARIAKDGIKSPSYGDAVRRLVKEGNDEQK
jgi:hypothetical protein